MIRKVESYTFRAPSQFVTNGVRYVIRTGSFSPFFHISGFCESSKRLLPESTRPRVHKIGTNCIVWDIHFCFTAPVVVILLQ